MRNCILINRPLSIQEISFCIELLKEDRKLFYTNIKFLPKELEVKEPQLLAVDNDAISARLDDLVSKFGAFSAQELEGKSYAAQLSIGQFNAWNYQKFKLYFPLVKQQSVLQLLSLITTDFQEIVFFTDSRLMLEKASNTKVKWMLPPKKAKSAKRKILLKIISTWLSRAIKGGFLSKRIRLDHLLLDHPHTYRDLIRIADQKIMQENIYLGYLKDQFGAAFHYLEEWQIPKLQSPKHTQFDTQFRNHQFTSVESILLKGLLNPINLIKAYRGTKKIQAQVGRILNQEEEEVYIYLLKRLRQEWKSCMFFYFKYLTFKKYFKKYPHLKSISSRGENEPQVRAILDAAKANGIKTVGIQHGVISKKSPLYNYSKEDARLGSMPDLTLVWGTYWEKVLVEDCNFPKGRVKVVGQIRTDIIPTLEGNQRNKRERYRLVYATQPIPDQALRNQQLEHFLQLANDIEQLDLVLKLHPKEFGELAYFKEHIDRKGLSGKVEILTKEDLYLVINEADALLTYYSTVGQETIYFNKPLIINDYTREDLANYHRSGVAFRATNYEELSKIVQELMAGDLQPDPAAYAQFIDAYAYKVDGKVSERIMETLQSF